jgi:hypothetical protein
MEVVLSVVYLVRDGWQHCISENFAEGFVDFERWRVRSLETNCKLCQLEGLMQNTLHAVGLCFEAGITLSSLQYNLNALVVRAFNRLRLRFGVTPMMTFVVAAFPLNPRQ